MAALAVAPIIPIIMIFIFMIITTGATMALGWGGACSTGRRVWPCLACPCRTPRYSHPVGTSPRTIDPSLLLPLLLLSLLLLLLLLLQRLLLLDNRS